MPTSRLRRPLLVGESNPYGSDPCFALYPFPDGCAGYRLCCLVMGLSRREYLARFDRANLCGGEWDFGEATDRARGLFAEAVRVGRPAVVLLGRRVADAFSSAVAVRSQPPFAATEESGVKVVWLPHPSGRCRAWNHPEAVGRARAALRSAGVIT